MNKDQWFPIESAPKDGTEILAGSFFFNGKAHIFEYFLVRWEEEFKIWTDGHWKENDELMSYTPTHWQKRPAPPELSLTDK